MIIFFMNTQRLFFMFIIFGSIMFHYVYKFSTLSTLFLKRTYLNEAQFPHLGQLCHFPLNTKNNIASNVPVKTLHL